MFSQSEIRLSSCDSVSTNESAEEKLLIGLITFIGFWYRILGIRRSPTRLDKLEPSFWQFSTTSSPATLCRERLLHSMQRFLSSWVEKNSIKSLIWNLNSYQSCRTLISFVWSFILPDQFRVFSNILSVSLLRQPDLSQFCLLWPTQRKVSWENYFPIDWELLYLCRTNLDNTAAVVIQLNLVEFIIFIFSLSEQNFAFPEEIKPREWRRHTTNKLGITLVKLNLLRFVKVFQSLVLTRTTSYKKLHRPGVQYGSFYLRIGTVCKKYFSR